MPLFKDNVLSAIVVVVAIFITTISAYYSVLGLTAIFPGAFVQIILMGTALEAGKVVTVLWIHRHWSVIGKIMKGPFVFAVIVLMSINSLGVFGFLSKAHLQQQAEISTVQLESTQSSLEVTSLEKRLETVRSSRQEMLSIIDRYVQLGAVTKATNAKREYQSKLDSLASEEVNIESKLAEARQKAALAQNKVSVATVDVGPIKYLAELVYGDSGPEHFDKAVRGLIILMVVTFDPLALMLLVSVQSVTKLNHRIEREPQPIKSEPSSRFPVIKKRCKGERRQGVQFNQMDM